MFRRNDCMEGHYVLGLFLTFASAALLAIGSVSTFIAPLTMLSVPSKHLTFGVFAYCTSSTCHRGLGVSGPAYTEVITGLDNAQLLVPIGAGLELLAFLVLVVHLTESPFCDHHLWFRVTSFLGALVSLVAALCGTALWSIARKRFNNEGAPASFGDALWIVWGGTAAAMLAFLIGGPAYNGTIMYRATPSRAYSV